MTCDFFNNKGRKINLDDKSKTNIAEGAPLNHL